MIDGAQLLIGGEDALSCAPDHDVERLVFRGDLEIVIEKISANPDRRIVILATGDPLFYGTARFLCDRLGKERFEVVPHYIQKAL